MKFVPLHIKTSLLASLVALAALAAGLTVISLSVGRQIQDEQKQLVALEAEHLADHLSSAGQKQFGSDELLNLANVVSGLRPNLMTVRVWRIENGKFVESVSSDDSLPVEELSAETENALRTGIGSTSVNSLTNGESDSLFRVFSPIVENNQVTGAVEAVERLDTIYSIASRYLWRLSWIAIATVALMAIAFYLLFQKLVYQPLERLLAVMDSAKAGDLRAEIELPKKSNEFGLLSENFNSMMRQIREMTAEREKQNEILQEKVGAATGELVQKNEQLETANLELFRATRKMTEMERLAAAGQTAAEFAHEVGTPLNLISGHAQLLQGDFADDAPGKKRVGIITAQIERIERIVREMLDRTRFGASVHSPLNLNDLLRKTFDAIEPTLQERRVNLKIDLAENLPPISGDTDRLQQVFINLFNNSLDAMPEGGEISISTVAEQNKIRAEFADTGSGLSDEAKARIFQPLFTTKGRGRGTGLGLFVVSEILQEHRAAIRAESETGKGTKFILSFQTIEPPQAA